MTEKRIFKSVIIIQHLVKCLDYYLKLIKKKKCTKSLLIIEQRNARIFFFNYISVQLKKKIQRACREEQEICTYQQEVDRVAFAKSQDGVDRFLNSDKLPGQLRNAGRIGLMSEWRTHHNKSTNFTVFHRIKVVINDVNNNVTVPLIHIIFAVRMF